VEPGQARARARKRCLGLRQAHNASEFTMRRTQGIRRERPLRVGPTSRNQGDARPGSSGTWRPVVTNCPRYATVSRSQATDRIIFEVNRCVAGWAGTERRAPSPASLLRLHGTVAGVAWPPSRASHLMGNDARGALSPVARQLLRVRLAGARRPCRGAAVARGGRLRTQKEPGTLVQMHALPGRRHD
jgi:hypothetical protein